MTRLVRNLRASEGFTVLELLVVLAVASAAAAAVVLL
jgi:prepilin-type N-terminal cleavage/methylation domain-containing protein